MILLLWSSESCRGPGGPGHYIPGSGLEVGTGSIKNRSTAAFGNPAGVRHYSQWSVFKNKTNNLIVIIQGRPEKNM